MARPFFMSSLWHHVSIPAEVDGFLIPSPMWLPHCVHVFILSLCTLSLSLHSLSLFSLSRPRLRIQPPPPPPPPPSTEKNPSPAARVPRDAAEEASLLGRKTCLQPSRKGPRRPPSPSPPIARSRPRVSSSWMHNALYFF